MKKILLLLACFYVFAATAQPEFAALKISPQNPKPNDKVTFEYNAAYSPLIKQQPVSVVVYVFSGVRYIAIEPSLVRKGSVYTGSFRLGEKDNAFGFRFYKDEEVDKNKGKGYFVPVYGNDNQPVSAYYSTAVNIYSGMGNMLGIDANKEMIPGILDEAVKKNPGIKQNTQFLGAYIANLMATRKNDAKEAVQQELTAFSNSKSLEEKEYGFVADWYGRIQLKKQADSVRELIKQKFPNGNWKKDEAFKAFTKEKDIAKKQQMLDDYIAKYPFTEEENGLENYMRGQIGNILAEKEDKTDFINHLKNVKASSRASAYNNLAWQMAEEDKDLKTAKTLSREATLWAKAEITKPTEPKPDMMTKKQWETQRKSIYSMYGDTYAFILYKLGQYKEGLAYAKDAVTFRKLKDIDYNDRYAMLLEKAAAPAIAKAEIEKMAKAGKASAEAKKILKNLYVKQKGSEKGYDTYLSALENEAREEHKKEIVKQLMNKPAPAFTLKDFDGKNVSLADFRGKVVVVDFWATWCGPCIASMPGMKMAQEKFPNTKFLFVDTWENVEDKLKNAKEFMEKKQYPFHVLMDDDNKVITNFGVEGIPTKFIVDKNGNIRFKAVGYNGSPEALVEELDIMIELAGQ